METNTKIMLATLIATIIGIIIGTTVTILLWAIPRELVFNRNSYNENVSLPQEETVGYEPVTEEGTRFDYFNFGSYVGKADWLMGLSNSQNRAREFFDTQIAYTTYDFNEFIRGYESGNLVGVNVTRLTYYDFGAVIGKADGIMNITNSQDRAREFFDTQIAYTTYDFNEFIRGYTDANFWGRVSAMQVFR